MRKACAECKHNRKQDFKGVCLKCLNDGGKEFEEKQQPRLIDANRLVSALKAHMAYYCDDTHEDMMIRSAIADVIVTVEEDSPTVETEPVVHAHWEFVPEKDKTIKNYWWDCSNCQKRVGEGLSVSTPTTRCPKCGARMYEEEPENDC